MISKEEVLKLKIGDRVLYPLSVADPNVKSPICVVLAVNKEEETVLITDLPLYDLTQVKCIQFSTFTELAEKVEYYNPGPQFLMRMDYPAHKDAMINLIVNTIHPGLDKHLKLLEEQESSKISLFPLSLEDWIIGYLEKCFFEEGCVNVVSTSISAIILSDFMDGHIPRLHWNVSTEEEKWYPPIEKLRIVDSGYGYYHLATPSGSVITGKNKERYKEMIKGGSISVKSLYQRNFSDTFILRCLKNEDYMKYRIIKDINA